MNTATDKIFKTYTKPIMLANLLVREQNGTFLVALPRRDCRAYGIKRGCIVRVEVYLVQSKETPVEAETANSRHEKGHIEAEMKVPAELVVS